MDDFFLRPEMRTEDRLAEIGGNVDYERFFETVIKPIKDRRTVQYIPFDCKKSEFKDIEKIAYKRLNIIEGSYSLHPYFGTYFDLKIFMDINPNQQFENILKRNGSQKLIQFKEMWIPKEEAYFKKYEIERNCIKILW